MGPQVASLNAIASCRVTSNQEVNHIHAAIIIIVIPGEVNVIIGLLERC